MFVLIGCQEDDKVASNETPNTGGVDGYVQKGPFVSGSNITIQVLDGLFNPTGQSYTVTTIDDFGSFELRSDVEAQYVEIIAQGYYFNEVSGALSNSSLYLRALSEVTENLSSNVNILTTLSKNRIIYLVRNDGKTFSEAKKQAEHEILNVFDIPYDTSYSFNRMDISKNGSENAILLAISCILQGNLTVGELSELISKFILDIENDGVINTTTIVDRISTNASNLRLASIRENLLKRYADLGIEYPVPSFENYAKRLVPLTIEKTTPENLEEQVRFDLDKIQIYFNKQLITSDVNADNIRVTNVNGVVVDGSFTYSLDSFKIEFRPANELLIESKYHVSVSENLKAIDDDFVTGGFIFEFNTVNIDISTKLMAYYPLNGNVADESGNGFHGTGMNIQYSADINGVNGNACTITGPGSYVELPNVLNMTEKVWTYSLWFKLDALDAGTVTNLLGSSSSGFAFWDFPVYIRSSTKEISTYNETAFGAPGQIDNNKWYHLTMVIDNGTIKFYVNGELKSSKSDFWSKQSNTGSTDFNGDAVGSFEYYTGNYYISQKYPTDDFPLYMKGAVDNVRFYKRALNKFEVKKLFDSKL